MEASSQDTSLNTDFGRIVAFTDGVFAIAVTLLVLNFDIPEVPGAAPAQVDDYLKTLGGDVLAYFLTFAVVGRLWLVHHRLFSRLETFDPRLMVLNLAYLSMIVLIPFPAELLGDYGDQRVPVVIYASVLGLAATLNWVMIRHAVRAGLVHPIHRESTAPWGGRASLYIPGIFLLSIPVALVSPYAAEAMWLTVVLARVARGWSGRRDARR
jgi:TMEM175 potassium channel family protein